MLATHVGRSRRIVDRDAAAAELEAVLPHLSVLEPTPEETALAAEIEAAAAAANLPVDAGESQLAAMLTLRGACMLLTGDKRAVIALAELDIGLPSNSVGCLEQLLGSIVDVAGPAIVRAAVCAEPAVDTAIALACSCHTAAEVDPQEGLTSYVEALRGRAPTLLRNGVSLLG